MKLLLLCLGLMAVAWAGEMNDESTAVGAGETENTISKGYDQLQADAEAGSKKRDASPPHIVYIMADDLGFNDIGFRNSEVISPNLDGLAAEGMILSHYYTQPVCTPSRHAMLSGMLPYTSRMQHGVLGDTTPHCSPLDIDFLPVRLNNIGYTTHMTGKWHLGYCRDECTPAGRGFTTTHGLLHGMGDFYKHTTGGLYDMRTDGVTDWDADGLYATDLFRERAIETIENNNGEPMFMFVSFTAVHTPLQVPGKYHDMYPDVEGDRRIYLAMMTAMDDAVGQIVDALKSNGMYDNTLIIFTSDNGGEAGGNSDNWPLRGCKASLWEGGARVVGFVHSPLIQMPGSTHDGLFHAVDWVPTLMHIASGSGISDDYLDGYDQYDMIMNGGPSVRDEIVYNIDLEMGAVFGQAALRKGDYKIIWGHEGYCDGWGQKGIKEFWLQEDNLDAVGLTLEEVTGGSSHKRGSYTFPPAVSNAQRMIMGYKSFNPADINSGTVHLFDLSVDPNEENDLAEAEPEKVLEMKQAILDLANQNYNKPPKVAGEHWADAAEAAAEANPANPEQKAWASGWCPDLEITLSSQT